jgi:hypothetical protein
VGCFWGNFGREELKLKIEYGRKEKGYCRKEGRKAGIKFYTCKYRR